MVIKTIPTWNSKKDVVAPQSSPCGLGQNSDRAVLPILTWCARPSIIIELLGSHPEVMGSIPDASTIFYPLFLALPKFLEMLFWHQPFRGSSNPWLRTCKAKISWIYILVSTKLQLLNICKHAISGLLVFCLSGWRSFVCQWVVFANPVFVDFFRLLFFFCSLRTSVFPSEKDSGRRPGRVRRVAVAGWFSSTSSL